MSLLRLNQVAAGNSPGAGQIDIFLDTADGELKYKRPDGTLVVISPLGWNNQNLLVNGGFDLAQAQPPGTLTTYSNTSGRTLTADNWKITNENASVQFQQIDTGAAFETGLQARYYGKFKKITALGKMVVSQAMLASDVQGKRSEDVHFQCSMRCSVASSMAVRLALLQLTSAGTIDTIPATFVAAFGAAGTDPTWGTNLTALTPIAQYGGGTISGNAVTCNLTTAWQTFSGVFAVPTGAKNLVAVIFTHNQPAINDELNISEAEVSYGDQLNDWCPTPSGIEIPRAQALYCKTFPLITGPAQNAGLGGALHWMAGKVGALAQGTTGHWRFPVTMRATPTLTAFNPSAANALVRDVTGAVDTTAQAFADSSDTSTSISCTGNAATAVGNVFALHITADATI